MPRKKPSIFSEILAWSLFGLLSSALALSLMIREHYYMHETSPASVSSLISVSDLSSLPLPTDNSPFTGASFLTRTLEDEALLTAMTRLSPATELLGELSGRESQNLTFNLAAGNYEEMIEKAARQHNVSPLLVKAIIQAESNFNPGAVSHRGAVGLMQVMPSTARAMGVYEYRDPQKNILAGVRYLKKLLDQFNDDEKLAIAAYNCGPEALKRFKNQIPPFRETQSYVKRVMKYYNHHLES